MTDQAMALLNYHHLFYFWTVVREGSVSKGAARLRLTQPTISAQPRFMSATAPSPPNVG